MIPCHQESFELLLADSMVQNPVLLKYYIINPTLLLDPMLQRDHQDVRILLGADLEVRFNEICIHDIFITAYGSKYLFQTGSLVSNTKETSEVLYATNREFLWFPPIIYRELTLVNEYEMFSSTLMFDEWQKLWISLGSDCFSFGCGKWQHNRTKLVIPRFVFAGLITVWMGTLFFFARFAMDVDWLASIERLRQGIFWIVLNTTSCLLFFSLFFRLSIHTINCCFWKLHQPNNFIGSAAGVHQNNNILGHSERIQMLAMSKILKKKSCWSSSNDCSPELRALRWMCLEVTWWLLKVVGTNDYRW